MDEATSGQTRVQVGVAQAREAEQIVRALRVEADEPIAVMRVEDYVALMGTLSLLSARIDWATAICRRATPGRN